MEKQYCRHCGENKGHATSGCKNVAAIKRTLACTDAELNSATERIKTLRLQSERVAEIEESKRFLYKVSLALLDLAALRREQTNRGGPHA